ncbi:MAG TPA: ankyrin repeat domain-containing protein [Bryobacteraceae bacterium]|nr:ankyrin repeat domain-containing protein [Bryobacteraceae bacterium]
MTPSKFLHPHSSFESLRKQAKKLARQAAAGDPDALARVHALLPAPGLPLTLRDAQFVLAREYGFAGWQDLRAAALRLEGKGPEWAAAEAERAIHDNAVGRLAQLVQEYPALLSWRGNSGESLLAFATSSFGDSGDPYREKMFTRIECAEFLLDAGARVEPSIWEGAISTRAQGVLQLLLRKGVLPRTLDVLAALGDGDGVRDCLESTGKRPSGAAVTQAFVCACRFQQKEVAALLLERCIEFDPALGGRVEKWRGRSGFIDYLAEHPVQYGSPWQTVVMNEVKAAMHENDLERFSRWLEGEPDLLGESHVRLQVELLENAAYNDRGAFIIRLMELSPALKVKRPASDAVEFALEYGHAHLIPLLTQIWPLPDDLPHAAGVGDFARVSAWFDEAGRAKLGSLNRHYPTNHPSILRNLHWTPPNAQQVLDVALAWACMNRQFEIASFLLERGANINTNWSTHEPASILHECAVRANYEAAQFVIDRGIDMTIRDYRWNATAEGWAYHAAKDTNMAEFLARAERARETRSD